MQFDLGSQNGEQPLIFPRLLNKIPRSPAHCLDRQIHVAPCSHDDDGQRAVYRHNIGKQAQPFLSGSGIPRVVQIDQHRVVGGTREGLARELRRADNVNLVALRLQEEFDGFENVLLVVRRQNTGRFYGLCANRGKRNLSPVLALSLA